MYDTTGFYLRANNAQNCLRYLIEGKEEINKDSGLILSKGKIDNLFVKVNGVNISISGSLAKFYFGNNLKQLTRKDTEQAIEKLSDSLHIGIKESKVWKLHIGANFIVTEPLPVYYDCLGVLSRFKRSEIANKKALLYTTSQEAFELYDKLRDAKRTKTQIPEVYQGKIVMRIESHFNKNLQKLFHTPELKAKNLFDQDTYIQAIDIWKERFFSIQRLRKLKFTKESLEMLSVKSLQKQLALMQIKTIGENELLRMIENSKGSIDKMQYSRLKKWYEDILMQPELTEPNELIKELDEKVLRVAKHYR